MFRKIHRFLTTGIWRIRTKNLPKHKVLLVRALRVVVLTFRGFYEDGCYLRASALTFYTLLSLVPLLAMAFGIATGFGLQDQLKKEIYTQALNSGIESHIEVLDQVIQFSNRLLENTKGGLVAGVGVFVLFWTVIMVLGTIESAFNDIWGIKTPRPFHRKWSDYLFMMLVCPLLFLFISSVTILVSEKVTMYVLQSALLGPFSELIFVALTVFRYGATWLLFGFIYIVMPNTRVNFAGALLGAMVTGSMFVIVQRVFFEFQIGVARYNAIYGSFAALPLFLVWLQVSWVIVLFGAEIAFAYQNEDTYEFEPDCHKVNHAFKNLLTLQILTVLVKNFIQGIKAPTAIDLSRDLEIPIRLVRQILFELTGAGLVSAINTGDERNNAYQPARDIHQYSIESTLHALQESGTACLPVTPTADLEKLKVCLQEMNQTLKESPHNILLKEI